MSLLINLMRPCWIKVYISLLLEASRIFAISVFDDSGAETKSPQCFCRSNTALRVCKVSLQWERVVCLCWSALIWTPGVSVWPDASRLSFQTYQTSCAVKHSASSSAPGFTALFRSAALRFKSSAVCTLIQPLILNTAAQIHRRGRERRETLTLNTRLKSCS